MPVVKVICGRNFGGVEVTPGRDGIFVVMRSESTLVMGWSAGGTSHSDRAGYVPVK